jgi:hypothetical protein
VTSASTASRGSGKLAAGPFPSAEDTTMSARPDDSGQQALRAFLRELPRLWEERPGQWVAYRGDQPLAFGSQKHLLYQECFARGLKREEFVIFCIEPQETELTLGPMVSD